MQPIYRVMLWYNNPSHFLTGWVEASVSTGEPSQPDKKFGGEHPMWLVTSHSPQDAGRGSWTGSGMIDAFFDYWLPAFVHEMRRQEIGLEAADAKYQQVQSSKDGASRPTLGKGRKFFQQQGVETTLDDFAAEAKIQDKESAQKIGREIAQLADTECGEGMRNCCQTQDLHRDGGPLQGWSSLTHAG